MTSASKSIRSWPAALSRPWVWLRFGLAGLLNTAFGYGMFVLLELMCGWPGAALAGATVAIVAFNFQTSRRFVFRSNGNIIWFVAVYCTLFSLNWAALWALRRCGIPAIAAQALLILPFAAMSFLGQQLLVFGQSAGPG